MIEQAFTDFLAAEDSLVALRGKQCTYIEIKAVQGRQVLPAQTWVDVGAPQEPTLDGGLGYQRLRIQIDHWGKDSLSALRLRDATRVFLSSVEMAPLSDGTVLQQCEYIGSMGFRDNDAEAFRCASEWYLHFNYPAPADQTGE